MRLFPSTPVDGTAPQARRKGCRLEVRFGADLCVPSPASESKDRANVAADTFNDDWLQTIYPFLKSRVDQGAVCDVLCGRLEELLRDVTDVLFRERMVDNVSAGSAVELKGHHILIADIRKVNCHIFCVVSPQAKRFSLQVCAIEHDLESLGTGVFQPLLLVSSKALAPLYGVVDLQTDVEAHLAETVSEENGHGLMNERNISVQRIMNPRDMLPENSAMLRRYHDASGKATSLFDSSYAFASGNASTVSLRESILAGRESKYKSLANYGHEADDDNATAMSTEDMHVIDSAASDTASDADADGASYSEGDKVSDMDDFDDTRDVMSTPHAAIVVRDKTSSRSGMSVHRNFVSPASIVNSAAPPTLTGVRRLSVGAFASPLPASPRSASVGSAAWSAVMSVFGSPVAQQPAAKAPLQPAHRDVVTNKSNRKGKMLGLGDSHSGGSSGGDGPAQHHQSRLDEKTITSHNLFGSRKVLVNT